MVVLQHNGLMQSSRNVNSFLDVFVSSLSSYLQLITHYSTVRLIYLIIRLYPFTNALLGNQFLTDGVKLASEKITQLADSFSSLNSHFKADSKAANDLSDSFADLDSYCNSGFSYPSTSKYDGYITSFADGCDGISDILSALPDPLNKVHLIPFLNC